MEYILQINWLFFYPNIKTCRWNYSLQRSWAKQLPSLLTCLKINQCAKSFVSSSYKMPVYRIWWSTILHGWNDEKRITFKLEIMNAKIFGKLKSSTCRIHWLNAHMIRPLQSQNNHSDACHGINIEYSTIKVGFIRCLGRCRPL